MSTNRILRVTKRFALIVITLAILATAVISTVLSSLMFALFN